MLANRIRLLVDETAHLSGSIRRSGQPRKRTSNGGEVIQ
jgi:hypothetical protein